MRKKEIKEPVKKEAREPAKKPEVKKNGKPVFKVRNPEGKIVEVA